MQADSDTRTVAELAGEAVEWFETATRDNGDTFDRVKDGAPEWIGDLCYHAHGDMFPDDWRYAAIRSALGHLAGDGDPDDSGEWADQEVDVYTGARLAWLASHLSRPGYCDDASREFGGGNPDIVEMVGWGQYAEATEVYSLVVGYLRDTMGAED